MNRKRALKLLWTLLLLLVVLITGGDTLGAGNPIKQIARPHLFSVASWEMGNFSRKWLHALTELFPGSMYRQDEVEEVRRYFEIADRVNDARGRLNRVLAGVAPRSGRTPLETELAELRRQRDAIESSVERTLEGMISEVLRDEDIMSSFLFLDTLWPPVDLRLAQVPRVLIVSPRDKIDLMETHLLAPDIADEQIEELERAIDARELSSLVEKISGVATYPSLVPDTRSLRSVLRTAAHEWVHHYLFFHPLGRAYWDSGTMTTVNETVADIVGDEVGREVYWRYFASPEELHPEPAPTPSPAPSEPPAFDFSAEMRETRLMADRLLAEGKVEGAEAYMEERRLFMADNGYVFRKLNQAFFAFHGTYADRPGSVNPIGPQLRGLYERGDALQDFLFSVARFSSYDALKAELGIED